ncbi:MAG: hypothetical protein ABI135_12090 [Rhodoferax sp.]
MSMQASDLLPQRLDGWNTRLICGDPGDVINGGTGAMHPAGRRKMCAFTPTAQEMIGENS